MSNTTGTIINITIHNKYGIKRNLLVLRIVYFLIAFNTFIKLFFCFSRNHNMNGFRIKIKTNFTAYFSFFSRLYYPFITFIVYTTYFIVDPLNNIESTVALNNPSSALINDISSGRITTSTFYFQEYPYRHIRNLAHKYSRHNL